ncbi:phosphatidate cytidylyltransferase [Candidatus Steffania adelgidicola]|nr:phosphatidate cytidylyltransferase [Candidatus Steffania adelgidicola]
MRIHLKHRLLKYRLITAVILIPIVTAALFLLPLMGFVCLILLVCMLSAWEWGRLAGLTSLSQRIWLAIIFGFFLAFISLRISPSRPFLSLWQAKYTLWTALGWWISALILLLCYPCSARFWRKSRLLRLIFGLLTILPFFWGMLALRQYHYDINHFSGAWWVLYVMVLVWSADSGAYIFGRMFGRHKLAQTISPRKTWEGVIGGLITSVVITCFFKKYSPIHAELHALFLSSIISIIAGMLGDLTESMFKREAGIKDSGYVIPGHGGILDRIDSLTAAVPVFICLMFLTFHAI